VDAQDAVRRDSRLVAAAIIAGGEGRRLGGVEKSAVAVAGRRIAERQLDVLTPLFARVIAVTSRPELWHALGVEVVSDRGAPGRGPLAGIEAALAALGEEEAAVVCVACDMPFLSAAALTLLRDEAPSADAVLPMVRGRAEPLFARYGRTCLGAVQAALATGRFQTSAALVGLDLHWLAESDLRAVDPDLDTLANVNTPADLAAAERRAR
jgi:molybdopterin-guanine dinucleotide biosynthesis protein A